jgi:hypothetical protein
MLPSLRPWFVWRPFDFRQTFVERFIQVRPSNFRPSRDFRLMFVGLSSCALSSYVMRPTIIYPAPCRPTAAIYVLRLVVLCFAPCCFASYALPSYVLPFRVLFFHPAFSSDICLISVQASSKLRWMSVWPPCDVCVSRVIPNNALYSSNYTLCENFIVSVVYYHKILGHGTTPCPRMMIALPLNQSPGINYEVTHNPLSRFLKFTIFTMLPSSVYSTIVI